MHRHTHWATLGQCLLIKMLNQCQFNVVSRLCDCPDKYFPCQQMPRVYTKYQNNEDSHETYTMYVKHDMTMIKFLIQSSR